MVLIVNNKSFNALHQFVNLLAQRLLLGKLWIKADLAIKGLDMDKIEEESWFMFKIGTLGPS